MGKDRRPDKVDVIQVTARHLETYSSAERTLAEMDVPVLYDAANRHNRLFVASFDGTGNSRYQDAPENHTNVAEITRQIEHRKDDNVAVGYVEGVGTQRDMGSRNLDLATGRTFEARLEDMYFQLCDQVKKWKDKDPDAEIRIIANGFSRGAEQAAAFTRLVHERGIMDPEDARIVIDRDGLRRIASSPRPLLVPPGETAQSVLLLDPVATFAPRKFNRQLPGSVLSGLQPHAIDEGRDQFAGTDYFDVGLSEGGRFALFRMNGAHSNHGGGYALHGLSRLVGNMGMDFINAQTANMEPPLLEKQALPIDPGMYVIHKSEQHNRTVYTHLYERFLDRRRTIEELAPRNLCKQRCDDNDPIDQAMRDRFATRRVTIAPASFVDGTEFSWERLKVIVGGRGLQAAGEAVDGPAPGASAIDAGDPPPPPSLPLAETLAARLPELSDEQLAHVLVQTREGTGIGTPDQLGTVLREGDSVFVAGKVPGFHTRVDLAAAPPLQESIARIVAIDEAQVVAAADARSRGPGQVPGFALS